MLKVPDKRTVLRSGKPRIPERIAQTKIMIAKRGGWKMYGLRVCSL